MVPGHDGTKSLPISNHTKGIKTRRKVGPERDRSVPETTDQKQLRDTHQCLQSDYRTLAVKGHQKPLS